MTVQQLSSPIVTLQSVSQFKNATVKNAILNGDLTTGSGNLSYALIAGGLSHPDPIWTKALAPSIDRTISLDYLGTSRTVNISNFTMSLPPPFSVVSSRQELVWDQTSGILLEAKVAVFLSILGPVAGFVAYTHVRMKDTNIFHHPNLTPGFILTGTSPEPVVSGNTATSMLTVTSINGFTGTVSLTDSVPSGLTCSGITPTTIVRSGTASLACNSNTPTKYNVTIRGDSDNIANTITITITVTAAPNRTPNGPATILGLSPIEFYSIIGIVAAIVATALVVLRTKSESLRETERSNIQLSLSK
jgi:hypothetical protein